MRITNRMMADNAIQDMATNLEKLNRLQGKISSTKQFQNISDDPARASTSLSLRSKLRALDSYTDGTDLTQNWMTATDNAFGDMNDIALRAGDLIERGLSDSLNAQDRFSLGNEMQTLLSRAVDIGNTTHDGKYIFSGYQVNSKAFSMTDAPASLPDYQGNPFTPSVISYTGDQGNMQRSLGPDQTVSLNVRGDQAFNAFLQNLALASNALKQNNIHNTNNPVTDPLTLQSALSGLQSSGKIMDQFRTANGARMRQVDAASSFLETVKTETKSMLSKNEDTNLAEGIVLLENQKTTYDAVLEVSKRAISVLSLFDYLQ